MSIYGKRNATTGDARAASGIAHQCFVGGGVHCAARIVSQPLLPRAVDAPDAR